jgi:hypothetical protein
VRRCDKRRRAAHRARAALAITFVDEIEDVVITADLSWESCENYSPVATNCVDRVAFVLPATDDA